MEIGMGDYQAILAIDKNYRTQPVENVKPNIVEDFKENKINIDDDDVMRFDWDYYKKDDTADFLENLRDCDGDTSVLNKLIDVLGPLDIMEILGASEVNE